ncbi:DUF3226 domain-containing protein [Ruminococcus sp. 5_1_39BFAA]|uniref:DUF3226 domain-containing protein n=1 Tax=Ruminococcus sp. 5_1_39BFAA TaxID=457412 RepID=UPI00356A28DA
MRSIILCEGSTDYVLIQYFLRKAHNWEDFKENTGLRKRLGMARILKHSQCGDEVTIAGCRGSSNLVPGFDFILESNSLAGMESEIYQNIVIVTDRDEVGTEKEFINEIQGVLASRKVSVESMIANDAWILCRHRNAHGREIQFRILLLIIPFEETGALETFLLKSIANNDTYDEKLINQCNAFVDTVDAEKRYLNRRRYITKAKFDVYFSIRTPAGQFVERQNVLKDVEWEKYTDIQECFKKLEGLRGNQTF